MTDAMTDSLAIPTVHLNGTSRDELEEQSREAVFAIGAAIDAMRHVCPNDRDYFVQGPRAGMIAREQHRDRLTRLESVRQELENIFIGMQKTA